VTDGAGAEVSAEPVVSLRMADGSEVRRLLRDVRARHGVTPDQFPDYRALAGDTSDNIPGVRGIGAKTAAALLNGGLTLDDLSASGRLTSAA
jgi:5'-3' exonuclease